MNRGPDGRSRKRKKAPVNLEDVRIDESLSKKAKIRSYVQQVKNPYQMKIEGTLVDLQYTENGPTLQDSIKIIAGMDE